MLRLRLCAALEAAAAAAAACYVLRAMCCVLCAACYVLRAMCCVLCAACYVLRAAWRAVFMISFSGVTVASLVL